MKSNRKQRVRTTVFLLMAVTLVVAALTSCQGPVAPPASSPVSPHEGTEAAAQGATTETQDTMSLDYPRWETEEPGEYLAYNRRENMIQRGREVYHKFCVGCHGLDGRGDGPAAIRLITQPRDFTSGVYKFRSTDSGSLPMETDIYRTITRGLSGVSMPAFPLMAHRDKVSVIEYIKSLYPGWEEEKDRRVAVVVPKAPTDLHDPLRISRGQVVYTAMQCSQCHGTDGRGTGATRTEYVDAWGNPQKPFDFTRGSLKGGDSPEDIYRTFHAGLRSIMPSYGGGTLTAVTQEDSSDFPETMAEIDAMTGEEQRRLETRNSWDLVAYIQSLRTTTTTAAAVLGTPRLEGSHE